MKRSILNSILLVVVLMSIPVFVLANQDVTYDMTPVAYFGTDDSIEESLAVLVRNHDEVVMMLHTSQMEPGNAVTAWWVIFNNPEACSDGICNGDDLPQNGGAPEVEAAMIFADGQIVSDNGAARFTSRLSVADTSNAYAFETLGLTDVEQAEIHLVVRTHGQALEDGDLLTAQLSTLNGGCENGSEESGLAGPNTCSNIQSAIFIAGS